MGSGAGTYDLGLRVPGTYDLGTWVWEPHDLGPQVADFGVTGGGGPLEVMGSGEQWARQWVPVPEPMTSGCGWRNL
jgi:hypothetical protein